MLQFKYYPVHIRKLANLFHNMDYNPRIHNTKNHIASRLRFYEEVDWNKMNVLDSMKKYSNVSNRVVLLDIWYLFVQQMKWLYCAIDMSTSKYVVLYCVIVYLCQYCLQRDKNDWMDVLVHYIAWFFCPFETKEEQNKLMIWMKEVIHAIHGKSFFKLVPNKMVASTEFLEKSVQIEKFLREYSHLFGQYFDITNLLLFSMVKQTNEASIVTILQEIVSIHWN
jgi:hypothetical protein